jgi:hypothetical protein
MRHPAMDGRGGYGRKILLINLRLARIFPRVNMQIAEAGENNLPAKIKIAFTRSWPYLLNQTRLSVDFNCALELAIMIGDPPLNAQHGQPFSRR